KELAQPFATFRQFERDVLAPTLRRKLALLSTHGMIRMAPSMLKDRNARFRACPYLSSEPIRQRRLSRARNNRKGKRHVLGNRKQAVNTDARRHCVVITPP